MTTANGWTFNGTYTKQIKGKMLGDPYLRSAIVYTNGYVWMWNVLHICLISGASKTIASGECEAAETAKNDADFSMLND